MCLERHLNKDIVDYALEYATSKGVEYAEVRAHREQSEQALLRNGIVEAYLQAVDTGFCVRILADGGIGFASTDNWTRQASKEIVDLAFKFARGADRRTKIVFEKEQGTKTSWDVPQKKKIEDIDAESKIATLAEIDKVLSSSGINMPARVVQNTVTLTEKHVVNTEGSEITSFVPRIGVFALITARENGRSEQSGRQFGRTGGWEAFDLWQIPEEMLSEAKMLRRLIQEGKPLTPGEMDLVCGPNVVGIAAHESCGHPMEADRILGREMSQAGRSFIYPRGPYWIGTRIGSPAVTVVDDPTVPNSYGYYEYDDEGVKARPRYLYKEGIINEFLHNRESAAKLGVRSNGASRSLSYNVESIVRMANTFVLPGDLGEDEILEDVKHGVYMKSFTEWNIDDKRFNQRYVGREAYAIENGELKNPLSRPIIETTTPKFWTAVDAVSKKLVFEAATCGKGDPSQGMPVYGGGPLIRLRGVYMR